MPVKINNQEESLLDYLNIKSRNIRTNVLKMIAGAKSGHTGGSLSAVEIITCLYFAILNIKPDNPAWEQRDRFILSKGHASAALYATLAERGFFPRDILTSFDEVDSILQGHPDMKKTPGVEISTGSLGQGLSVGVGMALAGKISKAPYRVYVLLGDGEVQEGQVWEAAMCAAHYKLDNLTAIIDRNQLQLLGPTEENLSLEPLKDKWQAFGWRVMEVNGHDFPSLLNAFKWAAVKEGCPKIIIAHTIKGKGVSFMEGVPGWHSRAPGKEQLEQALAELQ